VTFVWERLADGVFRCRLSFLDVTVGLVYGRTGTMLIDTGTTLTEARAIAGDVLDIANRKVSHVVLTLTPWRGRRRWSVSSRPAARRRYSCRATAPWSTRRSSDASKTGCARKCDESQTADVT
jgi:hypothetical protein